MIRADIMVSIQRERDSLWPITSVEYISDSYRGNSCVARIEVDMICII